MTGWVTHSGRTCDVMPKWVGDGVGVDKCVAVSVLVGIRAAFRSWVVGLLRGLRSGVDAAEHRRIVVQLAGLRRPRCEC